MGNRLLKPTAHSGPHLHGNRHAHGRGATFTTPIPEENPNQTLIWRETVGGPTPGVINAGTPGTFTAVAVGEFIGGVTGGPAWLTTAGDQSTRQRFCAAVPDTTLGSGVYGYRATGGLPASGLIHQWLRPTLRFPQGAQDAPQPTFNWLNGGLGNAFAISLYPNVVSGARFGPAIDLGTPVIVPYQWFSWWMAWGGGNYEIWIQQSRTASPVMVASGAFDPANGSYAMVNFTGGGGGSGFCGQVGPLSLYSATNLAAAEVGPGGFLWPDQAGTAPAYVLDAVSGSDSNIVGPWQTWAAFQSALDDCVVMGTPSQMANYNGAKIGATDLTTPDARDLFARAIIAGAASPAGTRITLNAGRYHHNADWLVPPLGCLIDFQAGAILSGASPMGGAWTQGTGDHTTTWTYGGAAGTGFAGTGRNVWTADKRAFDPLFGADLAAVQAALDADPWKVFTSATGTTSISLPVGVTPTDTGVGPLWGTCAPVSPNFIGCWVRNATAEFYRATKFQEATTNQLEQLNAYQTNSDTLNLTIFENCNSIRFGRKWGGFAHNGNDDITIVITPSMSFGPTSAVSNQAWVGYTDQTTGTFGESRPPKFVTFYYAPVAPGASALDVAGSNAGTTLGVSFAHNYEWISHGTVAAPGLLGMARVTVVAPPTNWLPTGSPDVPFTAGPELYNTCVEFVALLA